MAEKRVTVADLASKVADLELRVQELERKTTAKEIARAAARYALSFGVRA
jgi:hypothetical protein